LKKLFLQPIFECLLMTCAKNCKSWWPVKLGTFFETHCIYNTVYLHMLAVWRQSLLASDLVLPQWVLSCVASCCGSVCASVVGMGVSVNLLTA